MNKSEKKNEHAVALRNKAEALLNKHIGKATTDSEAEKLKLIHELQVHQVELEMQNEELIQAKTEAEAIAEKYNELYDFAPTGYFTFSRTGEILELNLCGGNMLGTVHSSFINKLFTDYLTTETKPVFEKFLDKVFETKVIQTCEVVLLNKGNPITIFLRGITVENDEKCLGNAIDVTEQKKTEKLVSTMNKIESLNVMAGGLAHDFNNLLSGVYGNLFMAMKKANDDEIKSYLSSTMETLERAQGLTEKLLNFTKEDTYYPKIDSLKPVIQKEVEFSLSDSKISTSIDVQRDLWPCSFDHDQIVRVIDNLVLNARQAMEDKGKIEIVAVNILISSEIHPVLEKGYYVKLSIKDFGGGILQEHLNKIFDPFFTTKTTGHGLGLTTSFAIARKHGGLLEVETEVGKGSTFNLYLPAYPEV